MGVDGLCGHCLGVGLGLVCCFAWFVWWTVVVRCTGGFG